MGIIAKAYPTDTWISSTPDSPLPRFAIKGGYDADTTPIYVGRCEHEGDMLPAKVIPSKGCAYVAWGSAEHPKYAYELLIGPGYGWVRAEDGEVPTNAVASGDTNDGERLYIGRGNHGGSLIVGKVQPSHQCLYIPFGGQEVKLCSYEVLVRKSNDKWLTTSLDCAPPGSIVAGEDCDGTAIYVARALLNGVWVPAKFVPDREEAYIASAGAEIHTTEVEVLVGSNYTWRKPLNKDVPPNAVYTGHTHDGRPLFVGRGHHEDSLCPGIVSLEDNCLFIPYGGREVRLSNFEVLTAL